MTAYYTFLCIGVLLLPLVFVVAFIVTLIIQLTKVPKMSRQIYPGVQALMDAKEEEDKHRVNQENERIESAQEELRFCQLFKVGPDMCLLIDHVEMCPDETAFIRVVDDEGYTPIYKRKVRRDKLKNRFVVFNGTNYYLDNKKTQPVIHKTK